MESEFFGHKRGSFTGAVNDKKGLVQSAEGGTLFLDEIADLPLHMQVKLLRVIQEKAVRAVGEQLEVGIDVRILSGTHKNLAQLVAEGKFREDLFYRVNVIELRVPSLRERPEDVHELTEAVLRRLGRRMKITPPMLGKDALVALEAYAFPGNVRELENILERAITLSTARHNIRTGELLHDTCARRPFRRYRTRRNSEGPGTVAVQQDGRGKDVGNVFSCFALSDQETRNRVRFLDHWPKA
jgi:two-component system response regulator PilR (NtrC family)